jgi:hypothetical protein
VAVATAPTPARVRTGLAAAGLAVVAVACVVDPVGRPIDRADPRYVAVLSDTAVSHLDRTKRYRFELTGELAPGAVDKGVLHELVRHGFDVRVPAFFGRSYGWRAHGRDDVDGVLTVHLGDEPAAGTVVAAYRPPAALRRRLAAAEAAVVRRLAAQGGLDRRVFPAFGLPTPPSVDAFVADNFLTMADAGFLGPEVAGWPETRALAEARRQPVRPVALVLTPP